MSIKPTVGRVVWFYPTSNQKSADFSPPAAGEPLAAIIAAVLPGHPVDIVNLTVLDATGTPHACTLVPLMREGQVIPDGSAYATWMPHQINQAKRSAENLQAAAQTSGTIGSQVRGAGVSPQHARFDALSMALRTPGVSGHGDVLRAAAAYQAHIEGMAPASILPSSHPVQQLADAVGGTLEHVERLPDGSGAAVLSMPLPANHWLTQPGHNVPPMKFRMGTGNPSRKGWEADIREAGRYAVRCATMNGTEDDFDPDALVQNLVVGMIGYFTPDGLSKDPDSNPPARQPG